MAIFISTLVLLFTTAVAMVVQKLYLQKVSVNYIALILGIVLGVIPFLNHLVEDFQSEVFMELIVAPLLFFEGESTQLYYVKRFWKSIVGLTVFMILLITLVSGFTLNYLTGMDLAFCFILAAIATPTDATASESVTHSLHVPRKVAYYLRNESLFNDASGIILLSVMTTWYVHRDLQIIAGIGNLIWAVVGGLAFGLLSSFLLGIVRQKVMKSYSLSTSSYSLNTPVLLTYLFTPFILYFLAEEMHISGVITVVTAGLIHNAEHQRNKLTNPQVVFVGSQFSIVITELLNGAVFVILGLVIVRLLKEDIFNSQTILAIFTGSLLYVINVLVRYLYTFITEFRKDQKRAWAFSLGGIHGAVTFALAYTLTEESLKSSDIHFALLASSTLIILSMIVPTIIFRFLLTKEVSDDAQVKEMQKMRKDMVDYAMQELDKIYLPEPLRRQLLYDMKSQLNEVSIKDYSKELSKTVRRPDLKPHEREFRDEVYRYAFRLERNYLGQIAQSEQEYREAFLKVYRETLLAEILFLGTKAD
ncbi:cation:proton antiporter [Lactobacillus psittaci]|nr:sodium:proton antiporter [Lactobacillus psittaci]